MKQKHLQHDLFLYEFAIRMLAVLATLLFTLLFFYGIFASDNNGHASLKTNQATTEYASLGDMH